jgi:hypothetical protein
MAISTYSSYLSKLEQTQSIPVYKAVPSGAGFLSSSWTVAPKAGATPTTSVACDNTTTGAINRETPIGLGTFDYRLVDTTQDRNASSGATHICMIADRLNHSGGLSGIVTTAQTTNLPTAALTRYTDGVGVMIGIEIYTAVGATATTLTASYTNQAGTAGQTTKAVVFGSTNFSAAGRLIVLPLQDGDTGVKSVESVTVLATTGTAGNFGVTLFKPLSFLHPGIINIQNYGGSITNALIGGGSMMEQYKQGCCLFLTGGYLSATTISLDLEFMDVT